MRIFDDVGYQHLEGRLLEGIALLFGSNMRVLAYPCPREELLHLLKTETPTGGCR
jgi:predicted secreted protein